MTSLSLHGVMTSLSLYDVMKSLSLHVVMTSLSLHDVSDVAGVGLQRVDADVIQQAGDQSGRGSEVAP